MEDEIRTQIDALELVEVNVDDIQAVNFKPHPFMIGRRHVTWASNHFSGILSSDAIEDAEKHGITCAMRDCYLKRHEHTYDTVCFVRLATETTRLNEAQRDELVKLKDLFAEENVKCDGFAFIGGE